MARQPKGPEGPIPSVTSDEPEAPPTASKESKLDNPKVKVGAGVAAGAAALGLGADALFGNDEEPDSSVKEPKDISAEDTAAQTDDLENPDSPTRTGGGADFSRGGATTTRAARGAVDPVILATETTIRTSDTTVIDRGAGTIAPPVGAPVTNPRGASPDTGGATPDPHENVVVIDPGGASPDTGGATPEPPENVEVIDLPDGTIERRAADGSYSREKPNGEVGYFDADGHLYRVKHVDGNVDDYGADGSVTTTYPDGTTSHEGLDGVIDVSHPDGTRTVSYPPGYESSDRGYRNYPDGAEETYDAEGNRTVAFPDGTETRYGDDGTIVTKRPDGTVIEQHLDNSTTVTHPDGTVEELPPVATPDVGNAGDQEWNGEAPPGFQAPDAGDVEEEAPEAPDGAEADTGETDGVIDVPEASNDPVVPGSAPDLGPPVFDPPPVPVFDPPPVEEPVFVDPDAEAEEQLAAADVAPDAEDDPIDDVPGP